MCGINGIVYSRESGRLVTADLIDRMRDILSHRGPDGAGTYVDGNVGLGHRRLSIVDLATGDQPMFNSDSSCVIVYNGEVYNHAEQRDGLISHGYEYHSTSDTETILHLYEQFGADCVHRLRGMFAFAIWNKRDEELFIARDRFGVKPLYYVVQEDGSFFFASEIKALFEAGAIAPKLNYALLPDHFANHGTSSDQTLFEGVRRLLPGHSLKWQDGKVTIRKYWDLESEPKQESLSDSDAIEEWKELFRESVKLRLMADVPLGMFLSGGIDSSAIAAAMSEIIDGTFKTFSVGFKERDANEFDFARLVSRKFKTEHHEITIDANMFFTELPALIWHEDEPLGFEASVPLYFVSKLAQHHVKVVLTGEGSDETLAGYGRYRKAMLLLKYGEKYEDLMPSSLRGAVRLGVGALPRALNRKLGRTFLSIDADIEGLYFDNFAIFRNKHQRGLFTSEAIEKIAAVGPYDELKKCLGDTQSKDLLDRLLYVDTKAYLQELLMKQDQMSMAASIESRVPFLDHKLVEYSARLPDRMKLRGRDTKWILRQAMRDLLPAEILHRPKMGFPVPLGNWLRGSFRHLVQEYVLSERTMSRRIFNADAVRRLVAEHDSGADH
ncbi:MAG TPA: asparagine synthase (glutamine-hydrolyzing), partial [Pyrinomonadaceae bacterium]|nr:asparagine synthase (glutamine-hydrolyzing) [Pyrinomonadaceae bacterium]